MTGSRETRDAGRSLELPRLYAASRLTLDCPLATSGPSGRALERLVAGANAIRVRASGSPQNLERDRERVSLSYFESVLLEDDVVDAVADFIVAHGWTIDSTAHAHQRGDDIVARKDDQRLLVEAKGEGSSKAMTNRFGQLFTGNQVGSHIGVAVVRALRWASNGGALPALAFPDNPHHRHGVDAIAPALAVVGIGVFWVSEDRQVTLESPWTL